MAILFCTCDGILNFQNIYYTYWSTPKRLRSLQQKEQQGQSHLIAAEAKELEALLATISIDAIGDISGSSSETSTSSSSSSTSSSNISSTLRLGTALVIPVKTESPSRGSFTAGPSVHKLHMLSAGKQQLQIHAESCPVAEPQQSNKAARPVLAFSNLALVTPLIMSRLFVGNGAVLHTHTAHDRWHYSCFSPLQSMCIINIQVFCNVCQGKCCIYHHAAHNLYVSIPDPPHKLVCMNTHSNIRRIIWVCP